MWMRPRLTDTLATERPDGFVLPGLAAGASVVVLLLGTLVHVHPVATAIATATLLAVVLRTALSVREFRTQTQVRHQQSRTDQLTGLGNRRCLFDALDPFFARAPDQRPPLAFLFIDLNRFKQVNDSFGHPAGDEVLRHVAARLAQSLRPADLVVRVGGDEFGVVLVGAGADAPQAEATAARIGAHLAEPLKFGGVTAELGASIGIALAQDASDAATLLANADAAMYDAKLDGPSARLLRDRTSSGAPPGYDSPTNSAPPSTQTSSILYYQPQLDLRGDGLPAVEALVRWRHPEHGLLRPTRFLPLAAEAGLMSKLTAGSSARRCVSVRSGELTGARSPCRSTSALRISSTPNSPRSSPACSVAKRLSADSLTIEITETSIIEEFDRAQTAVGRLRELGVEVAVDDFGAGFTSLAYLSELRRRRAEARPPFHRAARRRCHRPGVRARTGHGRTRTRARPARRRRRRRGRLGARAAALTRLRLRTGLRGRSPGSSS